jgi:hypothetical protein
MFPYIGGTTMRRIVFYSVQTFCDEEKVYMLPILRAYPQIRCSVLFMGFKDALSLMIEADNK